MAIPSTQNDSQRIQNLLWFIAHLDRRHPIVRLTGLIALCLAVVVLGVIAAAGVEPIPPALDLPPALLPGSLLPKEVSCYTPSDEHMPRCDLHYGDNDVYFNFDTETQIINQTVI